MASSITPSPDTNNCGARNAANTRRPTAPQSNLDRQLDAAISLVDVVALRLAAGIRDVLLAELESIANEAADRRWTEAELAHAVACASARSARLTVILAAVAPEKSPSRPIAAAVHRALRRLLPNQGGDTLETGTASRGSTAP